MCEDMNECRTWPLALVETMTREGWVLRVRVEGEKEVHNTRGHRLRRALGTHAKQRVK